MLLSHLNPPALPTAGKSMRVGATGPDALLGKAHWEHAPESVVEPQCLSGLS